MSVKLFFLRYSSWRFKQFSKSANVLIRLTLNASTSTPRMRRMMETSLSSLPQQLSFLIAPKSDCLDRAMTISSVRRAMVSDRGTAAVFRFQPQNQFPTTLLLLILLRSTALGSPTTVFCYLLIRPLQAPTQQQQRWFVSPIYSCSVTHWFGAWN